MDNETLAFDIPGIMECQKNRYPMLFLDRVTECVPGEYAKGFKKFSYNEWFFHGYETSSPKVWNVIQIEAMSQLFLMTFLSKDELRGSIAVSNKFDKVQFFRKIVPGECLELEATLESFGRGVAKGKVIGSVNGEPACSMTCTIIVPKLFGNFLNSSPKLEIASNLQPDILQTDDLDFGIEKIKECLLNKYPWLFLDKVTEITPGKSVTAIKNFTYNEFYFPEHFPEDPSVPGFIQIEACMQSFLLTFLSLDEYKRRETADRILNNVLVKRKIIPGDTLEMHAKLDRFNRGIAKGRIESFVNGEQAVSFEVTVVIPDEMDRYKPKSISTR
jgi:3-hydroxyacyl-[acyl-carrier-protein] dehydratase